MFIGREKELRWLEEQYQSDGFEMCILYGRRRVGKTALIQRFISDKKTIFFLGTEASEETNLALFSRAVTQTLYPGMDLSPFASFEAAFEQVAKAAQGERLILAIDEYPYLAEAVPGFSSRLQRIIDLHFKNSRCMLILCGSSMHFMEQQVLSQKSPLYGRRTSQMKIQPFSFGETSRFFKGHPAEDIAVYHGVTGGVAEYLSFIRPERGLDDNIISLYFESRGRLYEEPRNLLYQELREPRTYNEVIGAIASGASKFNDIATKTALSSSGLNPYLRKLMALHIVKKELPPGKQGAKQPIYRVSDGMYRFWYRFVRKAQRFIETDQGAAYYRQQLKPQITAFMGEAFEQMAMEYVQALEAEGGLPDMFLELGRWWGTDHVERKPLEIDLLGIGSRYTLLGEAKWTQEKVGRSVWQQLQQKGQGLIGEKLYFIFSKNGFKQGLMDEAKGQDNLTLVHLEDISALLSRKGKG